MKFIRDLPFLKQVFPPSSLPRSGPSDVSDVVYLTSDYFGGGYSLPDPQQWFSTINVTKTQDNQIKFITILDGDSTKLFRILRVSIASNQIQTVGLTAALWIVSPDDTISVVVSPQSSVIAAAAPANFLGEMNMRTNVMMPGGAQLKVYYGVGDNVPYTITFFFVQVPRGTWVGP